MADAVSGRTVSSGAVVPAPLVHSLKPLPQPNSLAASGLDDVGYPLEDHGLPRRLWWRRWCCRVPVVSQHGFPRRVTTLGSIPSRHQRQRELRSGVSVHREAWTHRPNGLETIWVVALSDWSDFVVEASSASGVVVMGTRAWPVRRRCGATAIWSVLDLVRGTLAEVVGEGAAVLGRTVGENGWASSFNFVMGPIGWGEVVASRGGSSDACRLPPRYYSDGTPCLLDHWPARWARWRSWRESGVRAVLEAVHDGNVGAPAEGLLRAAANRA